MKRITNNQQATVKTAKAVKKATQAVAVKWETWAGSSEEERVMWATQSAVNSANKTDNGWVRNEWGVGIYPEELTEKMGVDPGAAALAEIELNAEVKYEKAIDIRLGVGSEQSKIERDRLHMERIKRRYGKSCQLEQVILKRLPPTKLKADEEQVLRVDKKDTAKWVAKLKRKGKFKINPPEVVVKKIKKKKKQKPQVYRIDPVVKQIFGME